MKRKEKIKFWIVQIYYTAMILFGIYCAIVAIKLSHGW